MKIPLIVILSLLLALPLVAQVNLPKPDFNPYKSDNSSFLGVNNLSMSHSIGFSTGISNGGNGYYLSRYTNHLKYSFNPKLALEMDLSLVNYGTTSSGVSFNKDNKTAILPDFRLTYKPSDSVHLSIEFHQGNPWMNDYTTPWYNRW